MKIFFALAAVAYLLSACTETSRNEGSWVTRTEMENALAKLQKDPKEDEPKKVVHRKLKFEFTNLEALSEDRAKAFRNRLEDGFRKLKEKGINFPEPKFSSESGFLKSVTFNNPWGIDEPTAREIKGVVSKATEKGIPGELYNFSFEAPVTRTINPEALSFKEETLEYYTVAGSAKSKIEDCSFRIKLQLTSEAIGGESWVYIPEGPEKGLNPVKGGEIWFSVTGKWEEDRCSPIGYEKQQRYVMAVLTNNAGQYITAQYIVAQLCLLKDGKLDPQCRQVKYIPGGLTTDKPACPPPDFGNARDAMKKKLDQKGGCI